MFSSTQTKSIRRSLIAVPLGAVLATLSMSVLVAPADAAEPGPSVATDASTEVDAPLSPVLRDSTLSPQDAIEAYWTPERMAAATPADAPRTTRTSTTADERLGASDVAITTPAAPAPAAAQAVARAAGWTAGSDRVDVAASPTVGRIFFFDPADGDDHSCSGSAVNSINKSVVVTAGHCVHGGEDGEYMDNWVFVPFYDHGDEPYGEFAARTFHTFNAWRDDSNHDYDVAMVTVWDNDAGQLLVNVVGGNGLSVNYSERIFLTVLAYPAEAPYDGQWQHFCRGTTKSTSGNRIKLQCGFTGGASGGPWLRAYSDTTKLGYVNGVMSTLDSDDWNRSPYFDTKVMTMFHNTEDDWT